MRNVLFKTIFACSVYSITCGGSSQPAWGQHSADFERQRAQFRAEFDRMRAEHRKMLSPSGQAFLDKMQRDRQTQEVERANAAQAQISAARAMKVTPSQCALAYEKALAGARLYSEVQPYFTAHYNEIYIGSKSAAESQNELNRLKRAYCRQCHVRGKDKIEADGHADVWLEGFDADKKGVWVNLRMVPEGNYWKIDGYKSETGLQVIEIPKL